MPEEANKNLILKKVIQTMFVEYDKTYLNRFLHTHTHFRQILLEKIFKPNNKLSTDQSDI